MSEQQADFDSPWKEALEQYFDAFMAFFFPDAHRGIDWGRGHEFLDKELQQVMPDAEIGTRLVDKLVKVWRTDGEETWVLVHVEVQGQATQDFAERMYVYNYRLFDRYHCHVASFAILADESPEWRPDRFGYDLWGCQVGIRFPTVKLLDYRAEWNGLEESTSPFATITMAHLKAQETRQDSSARLEWKLSLLKRLYERGLQREDILALFRFIDWVLALPEDLSRRFEEALVSYEQEKNMPYVTSVERIGIEKGIEQGIEQGILRAEREDLIEVLDARFGQLPQPCVTAVCAIEDSARLKRLLKQAATVPSLEEFRRLLRADV